MRWHRTYKASLALCAGFTLRTWVALGPSSTNRTALSLDSLITLWTSSTDFALDALSARFTTQTLRTLIALQAG